MGFTPSFLKPNPPPLDFQQTKDNPRPQHFEHAPSDVGFGDKGDVDEGGGRGVQHVEQSSDAARMDAAELDDAVIAAEGEDKMNSFTYLLACAAGLSLVHLLSPCVCTAGDARTEVIPSLYLSVAFSSVGLLYVSRLNRPKREKRADERFGPSLRPNLPFLHRLRYRCHIWRVGQHVG
jgi:hypothetical protein